MNPVSGIKMDHLERGLDATEMGEMFRALCELMSIERPLTKLDALVIRPGMGEMDR